MATLESYRTRRKRIDPETGKTVSEVRHLAVVRIRGFRRTSKSFATRQDAKDWASEIEREFRAQRDRGGARAEVGTITIRQLAEKFLADPAMRQLKWLDELEQLLAQWVAEYGGVKARSFGRLQITALRDKLATRGLSPARTNRYLAAARRMWRWAGANGYALPSAIWPSQVMLKEPAPKEVIATEDEVAAIFKACDDEDQALGTLARFLVGTGARLSDALAVTWRDVDQNAGDVAIRGQKIGKPLRVAMLAPAKEAIRCAAKLKHTSGRVFWQFEHRMSMRTQWVRARANFPESLQNMRLHDCRHLCASLLAMHGATDVELAAQLGHSTLAMVKRYSHLRGGHRGVAHDKLDKALGGKTGAK
jgi:integrase